MTENVIVNYQLNDKFTGPAAKILNTQRKLNNSTLSGNTGKENNKSLGGALGLLTASIFGLSSSTKKASKALDKLAKSSSGTARKFGGVINNPKVGGVINNLKGGVVNKGVQGFGSTKLTNLLLGLKEGQFPASPGKDLVTALENQIKVNNKNITNPNLISNPGKLLVDNIALKKAIDRINKINNLKTNLKNSYNTFSKNLDNTSPNFIGPQPTKGLARIQQGRNAAQNFLPNASKHLSGFASALGPAIQAVAVFAIALGAIATQVIPSLLQAGARLESLERGVTNAGPDGERNLGRLRELSKLPGINFEGAASASVQLQAVGFDAILAERAIKGFSNALLRSGRSSSELEGIGTALSQIVGKGTVSAEEINQIAERLPSIRRTIQETFGTVSGEEITKKVGVSGFITGIIDTLEKQTKSIPAGLGDILSQLNDSFNQVTGKIGIGLGKVLIPILDNVSTAVDKLSSSGFFERLGALSITNFLPAPSEINGIIANIIAGVEQIPSALSTISSIAAEISSIFKSIAKTILAIENSPIGKAVNFVSDKVGGLIPGYSQTKAGVKSVLENIAGSNSPDFESRRKSILETLNKAAAPLEDLGKGKLDVLPNEITKVANNTSELVELQKKAIDLNRQILGGGQLASEAVSPMNLSSRYPSTRTMGDQITRVIYTGMAAYNTGYRGRK